MRWENSPTCIPIQWGDCARLDTEGSGLPELGGKEGLGKVVTVWGGEVVGIG